MAFGKIAIVDDASDGRLVMTAPPKDEENKLTQGRGLSSI